MANITKPAVERHSCDIKGCDSLAENPLYWNVSFPIIAQDNNDSGIPAMRSSDPDYLVFEIGESVFRALLPADPTHAASRLIRAAGACGGIIAGYRKTVAGLGRVEANVCLPTRRACR